MKKNASKTCSFSEFFRRPSEVNIVCPFENHGGRLTESPVLVRGSAETGLSFSPRAQCCAVGL